MSRSLKTWRVVLSVVLLGALMSSIATPARAQISGAINTSGWTDSGTNNADGSTSAGHSFPTDDGTTLTSRYTFNVNADVGTATTREQSGVATHRISFDATAPGGYRLDISTSFVGGLAVTLEFFGGLGSADVGGVTGSTSFALSSGSLSIADAWGPVSQSSDPQEISGSSAATIFHVSNGSPQSHTLTFTFDAQARSLGAEAAVRLGNPAGATENCDACGYPGDPERTQSTDGHFVSVTFTSLCGNGAVDTSVGEACDAGTGPSGNGSATSCCTSTCQFATTGQTCRASAGECDPAEACPADPGPIGACPADAKASSGTACADANPCTIDQCDGVHDSCGYEPAGTSCGSSADADCTNPDTCDGSGGCLGNDEGAGLACGDASDTDCTNPDTCNGGGSCLANDEPASTPCADSDACTNGDVCNGGGTCLSGVPFVCPACSVCATGGGCTAAADLVCEPGAVGKSSLWIGNDSDDTKDLVTFRWKGANAITKQDFGSPMSLSDYQLCIYDDKASPGQPATLVYSMTAPAGGTCGALPCWKELESGYLSGYLHRDNALTPEGVQKVRLRGGPAGRAKILFRAKGDTLDLVPHSTGVFFSQSNNVTVVVAADNAPKCFRAVFSRPWLKNVPSGYRDRD